MYLLRNITIHNDYNNQNFVFHITNYTAKYNYPTLHNNKLWKTVVQSKWFCFV